MDMRNIKLIVSSLKLSVNAGIYNNDLIDVLDQAHETLVDEGLKESNLKIINLGGLFATAKVRLNDATIAFKEDEEYTMEMTGCTRQLCFDDAKASVVDLLAAIEAL